MERQLLSGDEAVALAALHAGVALGTGYPGTPSTEILEAFSELGGRAQWAPNEKVALEVGLGAAFANARTLVTMKHVGLNVAADPLFTAAYTGRCRRADRGQRGRPGHVQLAERAGQSALRGRGRAAGDRTGGLAGGLRLLLRRGRDLGALAPARPVPDDDPGLPFEVGRGCARRLGAAAGPHARFRARHLGPGHDPGQRPAGPPPAPRQARRDRRLGRGLRAQPRRARRRPHRPHLRHRRRRRLLPPRGRSGARRQHPQDRPGQPAAHRARPRVRRRTSTAPSSSRKAIL